MKKSTDSCHNLTEVEERQVTQSNGRVFIAMMMSTLLKKLNPCIRVSDT